MTTAKYFDVFDSVEFSIEMDGKRTICWISLEALEDHFGATKETACAVTLANLSTIAPVAERVRRATPDGERAVVKTAHL